MLNLAIPILHESANAHAFSAEHESAYGLAVGMRNDLRDAEVKCEHPNVDVSDERTAEGHPAFASCPDCGWMSTARHADECSRGDWSMVKEIPLTRGKIALVSDEDYDRVSAIKWYAERKVSCSGRERFYARGSDPTKRKKLEYLHLLLMGGTGGLQVDHIDCNGLNCTRENLRLATHTENMFNKGTQHNNTSGFKGVTLHKPGIWRARVVANKHAFVLAYTRDIQFAARVYDVGAFYLHGAFANLNFETLDDAAIEHVNAWFIRNGKEQFIP